MTKIRFEDRFQDPLQRALDHSIPNTRDLEPADFAVPLGNFDPAVGPGFVGLGHKVFLYGLEKSGPACFFNVSKSHAVYARGAAVSLSLQVRRGQNLDSRHMHENPPKTMLSLRLRLPVYPPA